MAINSTRKKPICLVYLLCCHIVLRILPHYMPDPYLSKANNSVIQPFFYRPCIIPQKNGTAKIYEPS